MDELQKLVEQRYVKVKIELINNAILSAILIISFGALLYFYLTNEINYYVLTVVGTIGVLMVLVIYFLITSIKEIRFLKKVKLSPEDYKDFFQEKRPGYLDNVLPEGKSYIAVHDYSFGGSAKRNKNEEEYLKKIADLEKELEHLKMMEAKDQNNQNKK